LSPALLWAKDHDRDLHRGLVAGLGLMLISRGRVREANEHLALALDGVRVPTDPLEAWLGNVRAYGLLFAGRTDEAWAALDPVIAFDRDRGDERELALALQTAAWLHIEQLELTSAIAAAEESLELVRRVGEPRLLPRALLLRVQTLIDAGHLDRAERLLNEAPSEVNEPTFEFDQCIATLRGDIALAREDHARALDHYATSLALAEQLGEAMQIINDGLYIAWVLSLHGHTEAALEADALVAAIARDTGRDTNAAGAKATEALAALRETAGRVGTEAAGRAAAIAPADRVSRILALTEAAR
jgi:tetratricopeptide (TPR) repeat protein